MMRNTTPLACCTNTSVTYDYTDLGALVLCDVLIVGTPSTQLGKAPGSPVTTRHQKLQRYYIRNQRFQ